MKRITRMTRRTLLKYMTLALMAIGLPLRFVGRKKAVASESPESASAPAIDRPRVLRVHNARASNWDYSTGDYTESIDYEVVKGMLAKGLVAFTGAASVSEAWKMIIRPYRPGDRIVIKPNLGNIHIGYTKVIMTSPQLIAAIAGSLIDAGFPVGDITVYDLTAHDDLGIIERWMKPLGVNLVFMEKGKGILQKISRKLNWGKEASDTDAPIRMHRPVVDEDGNPVVCYIPKVVSGAQHLINVPVFKAHQFILQSGALKNHFGTVRFSNGNVYPVVLHGEHIASHIADINADAHIQGKTRLCVADALFGAGCFSRRGYDRRPTPWKILEKGQTPCSLFFSRDPVALESVLGDYIAREQQARGVEPFSDEYLKRAAELGVGVYEKGAAERSSSQINFTTLTI